jgi:hypothetical protein
MDDNDVLGWEWDGKWLRHPYIPSSAIERQLDRHGFSMTPDIHQFLLEHFDWLYPLFSFAMHRVERRSVN